MKKKYIKVDIGTLPERWKYSKEPRTEGLIKMLSIAKLNYTNIDEKEFNKLLKLSKGGN